MDLGEFIGRSSDYSGCVSALDLFSIRDLAVDQGYSSLEELILNAHWEEGRASRAKALGVLVSVLLNKNKALSLNYTLFAKLGVRDPVIVLEHYLDYLVCRRRLPPIDLLDLTDKKLKVQLRGKSLSGSIEVNNTFVVRSRVGNNKTSHRLDQLDQVILGHVES
uniref:Uncharacterized protein n=1 Tax=Grapevine virus H TaxID=2045345 RepID=A0A4D6E9S6_9VIRU|nr:hypothetical protein [Grapevine virus H]